MNGLDSLSCFLISIGYSEMMWGASFDDERMVQFSTSEIYLSAACFLDDV
ncbi:MAG: hypothetical protein Hyperionvirus22_7 [Hyperionvirus sp.]|uniref:Uncharacterized protein n=1 Tax=Hyperionvirus sp. TaxID=2487770 RepID=A0A3G5AAQ1_9VIRU|nr:MAG: hypothetical protein Hyperionvirus22_7 [Hyperionvirus sp.]